MFAGFHHTQNYFCFFTVAFFVAAAWLMSVGGAEAATPANLQGFCSSKFPNSQYTMRRTRLGPRHFCRRSGTVGGYTMQGIHSGSVCQWQTGQRAYRQNGRAVMCAAGARTVPLRYNLPKNQRLISRNVQPRQLPVHRAAVPTAPAPRRPNLAQYCARTHHMSQPNYSLLDHRVNYSAACQMTTGRSNFRFNGSRQNPACT